jgi:hypothetical protein
VEKKRAGKEARAVVRKVVEKTTQGAPDEVIVAGLISEEFGFEVLVINDGQGEWADPAFTSDDKMARALPKIASREGRRRGHCQDRRGRSLRVFCRCHLHRAGHGTGTRLPHVLCSPCNRERELRAS